LIRRWRIVAALEVRVADARGFRVRGWVLRYGSGE
jgi:hypothetical protein